MPQSHTMLRARLVATWMSFAAPVVFWLKTISSATRPPIAIASIATSSW